MTNKHERELLLLDAGNTSVLTGVFSEGDIEIERIGETELNRLPELWRAGSSTEERPGTVLLSSVNPEVAERLTARLRAAWNLGPACFRTDFPAPIEIDLPETAMVGDDRLLNAAGAWIRYQKTCIVVDCGTAVTIDVVRGGAFQGGVIAPGLEMSARALRDQTELIPEIAFEPVRRAIGDDTESAVRSGLTHGFTGMVKQILREVREELDSRPLVVGTGGTLRSFDRLESEFDHMDSDLTLFGLLKAWKRA